MRVVCAQYGTGFVNKPKRGRGGEQQEEEGREQITVKCVLVVEV